MDTIDKICGMMDQKRALFQEYETATNALTDCDADDIPNYITKRTQLAIEIDKIDAEIEEICMREENGAQIRGALFNRCNYGDLPDELRRLFDWGQEVCGIVSRIKGLEPSILERIKGLRDHYKAKIASTKSTPKIAQYLSGMGSQQESGMLLDERYSKV